MERPNRLKYQFLGFKLVKTVVFYNEKIFQKCRFILFKTSIVITFKIFK
jgi:hypothetical protein